MNNRIKKVVILALVFTYLFSNTVFARDVSRYNEAKNEYVDTPLLKGGEVEASDIVYGNERSTAMGAASCSVRNWGKGIIKVSATTDMFKPVDWAGLTLYLERWDEDDETWRIVAEFEKEFLPEEEDDGELTSVTLEASVSDQPMGYYYRARALHELEFDGSWYEIRVTKTNGILIEYVP